MIVIVIHKLKSDIYWKSFATMVFDQNIYHILYIDKNNKNDIVNIIIINAITSRIVY